MHDGILAALATLSVIGTLMTASTVFVAVPALALSVGPVLYSVSVAMLWSRRQPLFLDLERRRGARLAEASPRTVRPVRAVETR